MTPGVVQLSYKPRRQVTRRSLPNTNVADGLWAQSICV